MSEVEIHPRAQMYYDRNTLAAALSDAKTRIEEWSYEDDAHGYCHERPDWLQLVEAVEGIEALREEMIGLRAAGAPLVGRVWVIHRLNAILGDKDDSGP